MRTTPASDGAASAVRDASPPPAATAGLLPMLLGSMPVDRFLAQHWLREPYAGAGTAAPLANVITPQLVSGLVAGRACDLSVVRDGRLMHGCRPQTRQEAQTLLEQGHSLVFRHAERHAPALASVAGALACDLHGTMDVHLHLTPAGHHGFGWHYDAEEVFFVQTAGVKLMYLRRNTLHPDPVPASIPADMTFAAETSPVTECRLEAGDWLYIPSGWWHMAVAHQASASLSLGLLAPTPLELLDRLRQELAADPAWRRRLPPQGGAAGHDLGALGRSLAGLTSQLAGAFASPGLPMRWLTGKRAYARRLAAGGWAATRGT